MIAMPFGVTTSRFFHPQQREGQVTRSGCGSFIAVVLRVDLGPPDPTSGVLVIYDFDATSRAKTS